MAFVLYGWRSFMEKKVLTLRPIDEFWNEWMEGPEFVAVLQEMEPELQAVWDVLRLTQGLPQKELAEF